MARLQIRTDANSLLAEVTVPDSAIPRIRTAFGGATNAETAAAYLAWLLPTSRAEVIRRVKDAKFTADYAAVNTGQATEGVALETDWPPT